MIRWIWWVGLVGCAHSFAPLEMASLPRSGDYPSSHSVRLLDSQSIRFKPDPGTGEAMVETELHTRVLLLRGRLPEGAAVLYSRSFVKIVSFEARVVLPDGTARDADAASRRDVPAVSESELFSDNRALSMATAEVPVGGVRELRLVQQYNDVRPWLFPFTFGATEPTELAQLTIEAPTGWEVEIVVEGAVERRDEEAEGVRRVVLLARKVPGFREEFQGLSADRVLPRAWVRLKRWVTPQGPQQAFESDRALSAWLHQRYLAAGGMNAEVRDTVADLLKGVGDTAEEKARVLYEYVAKHIEYCVVGVGYSGWLPHTTQQIQKVRYGDCKDKANYLRTLLTEAGIDSQIAVIDSHHGFPKPFVLPMLSSTFNHAIVAINLPSGRVFADPTERTVPFGLLPARDCESPALLLSAEGDALTQTPSFGPARNSELQHFTLRLDEAGKASGVFQIVSRGQPAAALKYKLLRGKQDKLELLEKWLDLKRLQVSKIHRLDAPDFEDRAVVEGDLEAEQLLARTQSGVTLLRLDGFAPRWLPSLDRQPRRTPFALPWLAELTGELVVFTPDGARVTALPPPETFESQFFRYEISWTLAGQKLSLRRHLRFKQRVIAPSEFDAFREAVRQVHSSEARAVVVRFDPQAVR